MRPRKTSELSVYGSVRTFQLMEVGGGGYIRKGMSHWVLKERYQEIFCFRFFFSCATAINANLVKDVSTCVVDTGGNFAAGFNDADGQFAGGVVYTGGAAWAVNIFTNL
jgi:hypothetical protein